jgi:hypothetical protein
MTSQYEGAVYCPGQNGSGALSGSFATAASDQLSLSQRWAVNLSYNPYHQHMQGLHATHLYQCKTVNVQFISSVCVEAIRGT